MWKYGSIELSGDCFFNFNDKKEYAIEFFKVMHTAKWKATLEDYADLNKRYISLSDIVIFDDMMFNLGFWDGAFSNYAEPLLRIIHSEYPSAKIIISSEELGDALHGLAYTYTSELGRTIEMNDKARALVEKTEELIVKLNNEFGSEVCLYCAKTLQCDAEYDYPKKSSSVNNRVTQTELIGDNGIHPTNEGILNQVDSYYRSICYVISKFFN